MACSGFTTRAARLGLLILSLLSLLIIPAARMIAQGDVLLQDQFDDNSNDWQLVGSKSAALTVGDSTLSIEVKKENVAVWVTPGMTVPDDVDVQVETTTPEPSDSGDSGAAIIMRADTRDSSAAFYQFQVTSSGTWQFITSTKDKVETLKSGKLKEFDPTASNVLKVSASGDTFTYSINGAKVGTFEDNTINNDPSTSKYIGLLATTYKGVTDAKIEFHNLIVTGTATAEATPTKKAPAKKTPTKPPKPTPTEVTSDNTLLQDNFPDDNPNGWRIGKGKTSNVTIADNGLTIQGTKSGSIWWTAAKDAQLPADVDVTVTATNPKPDPNSSWSYGLGVRDYMDGNDEYMYLYEVTGAGKWIFSKIDGSKGQVLISQAASIKGTFKASAANILRVVASGSHFDFYFNGKKVGEADDDSITAPDQSTVALAAGTYDKSSKITVTFTDLTVVSPAQ